MMNERIRELARRVVGKNKNDVDSISLFDEQIDQFAKLIVKECIDQISVNHDPNSDWDWEVSRGHAIAIIKEHFGVKE
jgi:hypothetical protein